MAIARLPGEQTDVPSDRNFIMNLGPCYTLPRFYLAAPLAICIAVILVLGLPASAAAQLSLGSTTGVLPPSMPTQSLILGSNLSQLQAQWQSPVNATQQNWIDNIESRADQPTSGAIPTTFQIAASDSSIAEAAGLRYAMTGDAADLNKAVSALEVLAIPALNANDFITDPEVLTNYLSAYDFIRGAAPTALPQTTRNLIENRLQTVATDLSYGNGTASNALAKIGATKALAGEILDNQALLNQGLTDLQNNFNYSTTNDGWYADSQGHYLNYILRHVALFAQAYEQGSGVSIYASLQPLFNMSIGMRLPDGTTPNVSDGLLEPVAMNLFTNTPNATDAANMMWYFDATSQQPYPYTDIGILNNDGTYSTFFALTNFNATAPSVPGMSPTYFSPGQGFITTFRQNWGPTSDYLMMSAGIDSPPQASFTIPGYGTFVFPAYHSAADTMEVLLASQGQYILVAPGYERTDLSNSPPGLDTQNPTWHNVVLVDGSTGANDQGQTMRPEDFTASNRLDSTEFGNYKGVSDFSTLSTSYGGANVSRSIAFPGENYFVVVDHLRSDQSHSYGFNLVGRGTQTVLTNQPGLMEVKWEYNGAQVIEHLVSTGSMSLATSSIWMQSSFNLFEPTQRMTASMTANNGMFLSIMETGNAGDPSQLAITNLSTDSNALALTVAHLTEGWLDTILAQNDPTLRTAGSLTSDAQYAYTREMAGMLQGAMIAAGTTLSHNGQLVFSLDHATTLSLFFSPDHILGTISADGLTTGTQLSFFHQGEIIAALLDGNPVPFTNNADGSASLTLTTAGSLDVTFIAIPEPASLTMAVIGSIGVLAWRCRSTLSSRVKKARPVSRP